MLQNQNRQIEELKPELVALKFDIAKAQKSLVSIFNHKPSDKIPNLFVVILYFSFWNGQPLPLPEIPEDQDTRRKALLNVFALHMLVNIGQI